MSLLWSKYTTALVKKPILTKAATGGVLSGTGDIISQVIDGDSYDVVRTLKLAFFGFSVYGPGLHFWYKGLEKVVPGVTVAKVIQKIVLDQTIFAPLYLGSFITVMSLLEGKGIDYIVSKQKSELFPTLKANWGVWIPANIVNFALVPINLRVLFVSCVSVAWYSILSKLHHKSVQQDEPVIQDVV
eukprot:TRINITY_DN10171_c0_g1_i1.p1 TRINITY_DN10171_c0_g1~~TRINITY_DN10171_c0_g1_i1.p1  ORF type:complete len:200 (-),score=36.00 TRINITY_DN10171_c0_g1_i1:60-617(-)